MIRHKSGVRLNGGDSLSAALAVPALVACTLTVPGQSPHTVSTRPEIWQGEIPASWTTSGVSFQWICVSPVNMMIRSMRAIHNTVRYQAFARERPLSIFATDKGIAAK